jgi:tetratricopeptide (TPR) repeat protein
MSSDELKYFDFIEHYVDGNMDELEQRDFEAQLVSNPLLKEEYGKYLTCINGIKDYYSSNLKNQLKAQDLELDIALAKPLKPRINRVLLYSIAATFALFITTFTVLNIIKKAPDLNGIASKYKEEEKGMPILMSLSEDAQLNEAMNLYKQSDYNGSLNIIQTLQENKKNNDTLIFYEGVNYEMLGNSGKAINCYRKLINGGSSIFTEKAQYRLALCYLQNEDEKNAMEQLDIICKNPQHLYFEQAKAILKELQ